MKKFTNLFFAVAMCLSLCACGTAEENLKKSNEKESINNEEPANNENSIKVEESENIKDSANVEDSVVNEDSINVTASNSQNEKPFEPYVFYREDYEIPDVFNTGYTNMIDYYNASPNGIGMGSVGNLGLGVYYFDDVDYNFSAEDSRAFRTYRGIGLGSSLEEVFEVYGAVDFEPPHEGCVGLSDAEHTLEYFVYYWAEIESGALMDIRFYFDQNDTVMAIEYGAVYADNVNKNPKMRDYTFEIVND